MVVKTDDERLEIGALMNTRNLVAEFIGTFALIFVGAGALAITQTKFG